LKLKYPDGRLLIPSCRPCQFTQDPEKKRKKENLNNWAKRKRFDTYQHQLVSSKVDTRPTLVGMYLTSLTLSLCP